jgi:hypothetical protein
MQIFGLGRQTALLTLLAEVERIRPHAWSAGDAGAAGGDLIVTGTRALAGAVHVF